MKKLYNMFVVLLVISAASSLFGGRSCTPPCTGGSVCSNGKCITGASTTDGKKQPQQPTGDLCQNKKCPKNSVCMNGICYRQAKKSK